MKSDAGGRWIGAIPYFPLIRAYGFEDHPAR